MKKIGLVTWFDRGPNYGTVLQAYSLQKNINDLGYECEIINYKNISLKRRIKRIILYVYLFVFRNKVFRKNIRILKWINKNLKITKPINKYTELEEKTKKYDAFVCGSDQIWSTAEERIEPFYYLQFAKKEKRISYAPSIGKDNVGESVKEKFLKYVSEIKYISVREQNAADIIKSVINIEPKVVLDPTLLLNKEYWKKYITKNTEENDYIFVYFLSQNKNNYDEVKEFANINNLKIISTAEMYENDKNSMSMNPIDFLRCINNAKYIATDSFHGTIFSIIFEKNFVTYKRFKDNIKMSQNSRIYNLLKKLELSSRLIDETNSIEGLLKEDIDYNAVNKKIEVEREESMSFLKDSIEEVLKNKEK